MQPWRRIQARLVHRCGIFDLTQVRFEPPEGGSPRDFYVIDAPDWINVIPVTNDDRVLMVRQYRYGIEDFTLEIPGGMCDPGESPMESARRELREETGYEAGEIVELGWVHPNPPVQNNRCFTFLARDLVRLGPPQPDPHERLGLESVPRRDIPRLIAGHKISHALVLAAFHLLEGVD